MKVFLILQYDVFPRLGKNPAKVKDLVSKPDAISAVNAALAPGNGTTVMPSSMAFVTRSALDQK